MGVHHPGRGQDMLELIRMVRRIATQTIQNASFGRAGLRVYDGGWIEIINGGLRVIGTAIVNGILRGVGTLDWLGPWFLKGKGEISGDVTRTGNEIATGNTEFNGDVSISKTLDVEAETRLRGETTLEADFRVTNDGKIIVGDMVIDPTGGYGKITFGNGTEVRAGEAGVTIANGVSNVTVTPGFTRIGVGGSSVYVDGTGIFMNNVPQVAEPGLPPGTLVRRNGRVCEVV